MKYKTLEEQELINIAGQKIKDDYSYMDSLPLAGWMWEFIRRGEDYKNLYKKCLSEYEGLCFDKRYDFVFSWKRTFYEIGLDIFFHEGKHSRNEYKIISFKGSSKRTGGPYMALPDFNKKYIDFTSESPSIAGIQPVKCLDYPAIAEWRKDEEDEEGSPDIGSIDRLLDMLSPGEFEKTLYFGVSRVGPKEKILNQISDIMDKFDLTRTGVNKKKSKLRLDKWRDYLIVYDLKPNNTPYRNIADLLQGAFPMKQRNNSENAISNPSTYTERNIEDYWNKACSLIDFKGYKKYLAI